MASSIEKKELTGSTIEVTHSKNKTLIGAKGKVINETKNTMTLSSGKKIIKSHVNFMINNKIIEGKKISRKIEDRIKK